MVVHGMGMEGGRNFNDLFIGNPTLNVSAGILHVVAAVVITVASVSVVGVITNADLVFSGWASTLLVGTAICFVVAFLLALVALDASSVLVASLRFGGRGFF